MALEKIVINIDPDLEELIPGFLENRTRDVSNLQNAAGNKDFDTLRSVGHSLKGVGGGYGFARITELGAAIETAAKSGDLNAINQHIAELAEYLQRVEIKYQ